MMAGLLTLAGKSDPALSLHGLPKTQPSLVGCYSPIGCYASAAVYWVAGEEQGTH